MQITPLGDSALMVHVADRFEADPAGSLEHVLAALRMPENVVRWVPYQRIVVPRPNSEKSMTVSVVAEIAKIDINLI